MHTSIVSRWNLAAGGLLAGLLAVTSPAFALEPNTKDLTVEQRPIAEVEAPHSDLMVSAWVDRADKTYRVGDTLTLFVKVNQDAYIHVIDVGTSGKVTIVFPNEHQTDNRVRAFQVVQIPARDAGFRFRVGGVAGAELLKIVATTRPEPLFAEQQAVAVGPFRQLDARADAVARDLSVEIDETDDDAFATLNEVVHILAEEFAVTSPQPEADGTLSPEQMLALGERHFFGSGAKPDYAEARTWYELAAAEGNARAMARLGSIYEQGLGVPVDRSAARTWYLKAADLGDSAAMVRLAQIHINGEGVMVDYDKAVAWLLKAAEADDGAAVALLAWCYDVGAGVEEDAYEAARHLLRALSLGAWDAQQQLPSFSAATRREVQRLLRNAGYYDGPIDTQIGPVNPGGFGRIRDRRLLKRSESEEARIASYQTMVAAKSKLQRTCDRREAAVESRVTEGQTQSWKASDT